MERQTLQITDNLERLLDIFPRTVRKGLEAHEDDLVNLIEVVMDLGRLPQARLPGSFHYLTQDPITREDLRFVTERVGQFGPDNRAGIEATLHRISAIRSRSGQVVGVTCRVGRAIYGTEHVIRDVVESGKSILLLGRPGVGKTTLLREVARVLADDIAKRVVIVDTSNEIAGDGDVPHPGIGMARRMQVPHTSEQHAIMIEAVENHMPEVIVVDEIGTEQEAYAARTIAELKIEIDTLKRLESMALGVRRSGTDTKWRELASLLSEIFTPAGIGHRVAEPPAPYGAGAIPPPTPFSASETGRLHRASRHAQLPRATHPHAARPQRGGRRHSRRHRPRGALAGAGIVQARPLGPGATGDRRRRRGHQPATRAPDGHLRPALKPQPD